MIILHNMSDEVYLREILRPTDDLYDANGDETAAARAVSLTGFRPIEEAYEEMMAEFQEQLGQSPSRSRSGNDGAMIILHNMSDEVYLREILRPTDDLYDANGDETAAARAVSLTGFRPIEEAYEEMMAEFQEQLDQIAQALKARQEPTF